MRCWAAPSWWVRFLSASTCCLTCSTKCWTRGHACDERRDNSCIRRKQRPARAQRRAAPGKRSPLGGQRATCSGRTWGPHFVADVGPAAVAPPGGTGAGLQCLPHLLAQSPGHGGPADCGSTDRGGDICRPAGALFGLHRRLAHDAAVAAVLGALVWHRRPGSRYLVAPDSGFAHHAVCGGAGGGASRAIGLVVGTAAGYAGGLVDATLMRITDIFLAFPRLILALAFVAALGPGIENAVIAIAITSWPPYARMARAETLTIRQTDYIAAVQLLGASPWRIVLRHIMPLCVSSVIVRVTLDMAGIILTAAGLGFLGLGAQHPMPEWGALIANGRLYVLDQWWVAAAPGAAIFLVSLAFNLLGDGLRDALDPKTTK